jgi:acyl carrier protein phosphodiesterase
MNFLAHSFLSFSDGQIVGNIIGDFVKNKDKKKLPEEVQQGVMLHRAIDAFTDVHPKVHEAKSVFRPIARLYSGAFVDVVFDYFLANDESIKSDKEWREFTANVYKILFQYEGYLPENFRKILPVMQQNNWLYNYRFDWGMEYSLKNVLNRAKYLAGTTPVYGFFLHHKTLLKKYYTEFFPDLQEFCVKMNETFGG